MRSLFQITPQRLRYGKKPLEISCFVAQRRELRLPGAAVLQWSYPATSSSLPDPCLNTEINYAVRWKKADVLPASKCSYTNILPQSQILSDSFSLELHVESSLFTQGLQNVLIWCDLNSKYYKFVTRWKRGNCKRVQDRAHLNQCFRNLKSKKKDSALFSKEGGCVSTWEGGKKEERKSFFLYGELICALTFNLCWHFTVVQGETRTQCKRHKQISAEETLLMETSILQT